MQGLKVGFNVKYGHNEIEIPITERTVPTFDKDGLTDKFSKKVTIYNDIPSLPLGVPPERAVTQRQFRRFVIENCTIQGGYVEKADNTIQTIANAKNVITKDVEHYKEPLEYYALTQNQKDNFYTVQIDDFIVFGEVFDVVTTSKEFEALQKKYSKNGFSVTAVTPNIFGTAVDNVTISNM